MTCVNVEQSLLMAAWDRQTARDLSGQLNGSDGNMPSTDYPFG
ncbi:MAG: hypothetical protein AB8B97_21800 [Granulosicoccus sp.]